MLLKERIFSSVLLRNMFTDLGFGSFSTSRKTFTPFFEYSLTPFKDEFSLHFLKNPFLEQYKNEIFNRLYTYNGHDIIQYLEYHYNRYPEKSAFLGFMNSETMQRLKHEKKIIRKSKLELAANWVVDKRNSLSTEIDKELKENIQSDIKLVLDDDQLLNRIDGASISKIIADKIQPHLDKVLGMVDDVTASTPTSNISLNNKNHEEKLIAFLLVLSQLQYPVKGPKAERLFNNFTQADISRLLNIHFESFKTKKINTVQKSVGQAQENLHTKRIKIDKLNQALSEYFFEP